MDKKDLRKGIEKRDKAAAGMFRLYKEVLKEKDKRRVLEQRTILATLVRIRSHLESNEVEHVKIRLGDLINEISERITTRS